MLESGFIQHIPDLVSQDDRCTANRSPLCSRCILFNPGLLIAPPSAIGQVLIAYCILQYGIVTNEGGYLIL